MVNIDLVARGKLVGIYIGNGKFIHASTPAKGIRVDNLNDDYYTTRFHSARRVIG